MRTSSTKFTLFTLFSYLAIGQASTPEMVPGAIKWVANVTVDTDDTSSRIWLFDQHKSASPFNSWFTFGVDQVIAYNSTYNSKKFNTPVTAIFKVSLSPSAPKFPYVSAENVLCLQRPHPPYPRGTIFISDFSDYLGHPNPTVSAISHLNTMTTLTLPKLINSSYDQLMETENSVIVPFRQTIRFDKAHSTQEIRLGTLILASSKNKPPRSTARNLSFWKKPTPGERDNNSEKIQLNTVAKRSA